MNKVFHFQLIFSLLVTILGLTCCSSPDTLPKIDNYFEKIENETFSYSDFNTLQAKINENDEYANLQSLFLPIQWRNQIVINNESYALFFSAYNAFDSLDNSLATQYLQVIPLSNDNHPVFKREVRRLSHHIFKETNVETIKELLQVNPENLSNIALYQWLQEMASVGSSLLSQYIDLQGMAIIHKALYVISTDERAVNYRSLKKKLLLSKARYMVNENVDSYETALALFDQYLDLVDKKGDITAYHYLTNRYKSYRTDQPTPLLEPDSILQLDLPVKEKLFLLTDYGFNYMFSEPAKSIHCFEKGLEYTDYISCSWQSNLLNNYLCYCYTSIGNLEKAKLYLEKAKDISNCTDAEKVYARYYNIGSEIGILTSQKESPTQIRSLHQINRILADSIFSDSYADHLDDYYVENAFNILGTFDREEATNHAEYIVQLFNDTKGRNLKRSRMADQAYLERMGNSELNTLLLHVNDFKELLPYDDPAYDRLTELLINNLIIHNYQNKKPLANVDVYLEKLKSKCLDDHSTIVSFLYLRGQYYIYSFSNNGFQLDYLDNPHLDSLIYQYRENISRADGDLLIEIRSILQPFFSQNGNTVVFPDGPLSMFPTHLLLDNHRVTTHFDINEWVSESSDTVYAAKSVLFSYSNPQTEASMSERDYPELPYAYEEVDTISSSLPGSKTYSGYECNVDNLINITNSDLLYLSTHASTSEDNRLDNYLILRDKEKSLKFYGYQVYQLQNHPKCVFLTSCDSGTGMYKPGSGTYSPSRSFLENGTQTIVKSLWKINDYATKEFMVHLYLQWVTGISLGEALHQTRIYFRDVRKVPISEWAGFVLEGNPEVYLETR